MQEFLESLDWQTIFTTIVAFLTANAGILLSIGIALVKSKISNYGKDEKSAKEIKEMRKLMNDEQKAFFQQICEREDRFEKMLNLKYEIDKKEQTKKLEASATKLSEKVQDAQSDLTIEELL